MKTTSKKISFCRACKNEKLLQVISLGNSPLANSFLKKGNLGKKELFFPLTVLFCKTCGLLQLSDVVNPDLLFKHYLYLSSTSDVFVKHFEEFAKTITKEFSCKKNDLIIDIGSNDGILLKPFKKYKCRVLGVDPAKNIAPIAKKNGVETITEYFTPKVAKSIVKKFGKAKIISGTNVFAHVADLDELISAVKITLENDGIFVIEVPYLVDLIQKNLFDTIYHEHLSYFSVKPLVILFKRFGMEVFDVKRVTSHGGSIRVFIKKLDANYSVKASVKRLLSLEEKLQLYKPQTFKNFQSQIEKNKKNLVNLLKRLKSQNKTIVGYGAAAKGNTMLNYFGINTMYLESIVDDNVLKQGLFTPGMHIPVVSEKVFKTKAVDYLLIIAWNFAQPIMKHLQYFHKKGGKFILPVPEPKIV